MADLFFESPSISNRRPAPVEHKEELKTEPVPERSRLETAPDFGKALEEIVYENLRIMPEIENIRLANEEEDRKKKDIFLKLKGQKREWAVQLSFTANEERRHEKERLAVQGIIPIILSHEDIKKEFVVGRSETITLYNEGKCVPKLSESIMRKILRPIAQKALQRQGLTLREKYND